MAPPSRIVELSALIHENTCKIEEYISSAGLPTPTFEITSPPMLPLPPHIQELQAVVLDAADELSVLLQGPMVSIASRPHDSWASIQAIHRFNIARSFPATSTATFDTIASACSLSVSDTRRILRHAMTYYIFREVSPGTVAHTAASKALAEIPSFGPLVGFISGEMWPACTRIVDAMQKWPGSEEPNEAGFALAYNTDKPMFEFLGQDLQRAGQAGQAMEFMQSNPGNSVKFVADNFNWDAAAKGVLVDVGGGTGTAAFDLARCLPDLKCIVQDRAEVIQAAALPEDLAAGRVEFMAHDFFTEQPVKEADIYFLRWILHDWSDKYAIEILQNIVPGLKKGARVLVSERCLPPPCVVSPYRERAARSFDMSMKAIQNANERDAEEWIALFKQADARFVLDEIKTPPGSALSMISFVWTA